MIITEDKINTIKNIKTVVTNFLFEINFLSRKGFSIKKYENIDIKKIKIAMIKYSDTLCAILRFLENAKIG